MTHWSLFLDESGPFDGQHGCVVAGLLVEAPLTHALGADHVVNRLFRTVTRPIYGPWPSVPNAVSTEIGIPIERPRRATKSPALPLLAAAGAPEHAVLKAANGAQPPPYPQPGAAWITEQATAWIRELP